MLRKAHEVESFLQKPDTAIRVILLYGHDIGAIREHARNLSQRIRGKDSDPMLQVDIDEATLAATPQKLYDEAAAIPMFGDSTKVIELTLNGDAQHKTIATYLDDAINETLVIIRAGNLKPASKLRKLIEKADNAMALPCYADDSRTIQRVARDYLAGEGFRIETAAMTYLAHQLGNDRGVTMRELERLVLYKGPKGTPDHREDATIMITLDDVEEVMGDSAGMMPDTLVDAVCGGQTEEADKALLRLTAGGKTGQYMLLCLRRHFQALHLCLSHIQNGTSQEDALRAAFRPPLHFKRKPRVNEQLRIWHLGRIETALHILHEAETDCRRTGTPIDALAAHTILRLARAGQRLSQ